MIKNLPEILRSGSFLSVDKSLGKFAQEFRIKGTSFYFDCRFCDEQLQENTYAFGIARELYIRNCYFKHQPDHVFSDARIVVVVGANRGAFSALMTSKALYVLSVECQPQYSAVIKHNFEINHFHNYSHETAFVGSEGILDSSGLSVLSMEELFVRNKIKLADFVKIDI